MSFLHCSVDCRTRQRSSSLRRRHLPSYNNFATRASFYMGSNLALQEIVAKTSKPVFLREFKNYFGIMIADTGLKFNEEYEQLKDIGRDKPKSAAELSANRSKNR